MTGRQDLVRLIARKGADPDRIAATVSGSPEQISSVLTGLSAKEARIKYGCAKVLLIVSEKWPAALYPQFDFFVGLLGGDNKILQWDSARILANLTAVDTQGKFEEIFDKYFAPIPGPVMITGANVIGAAARIANAKPWLTDRIAAEVLKVEKAKYQTAECRNVALGHAIQSFDQFFHQIRDKGPVIRLIRRQLKNTRPSTRKKAERFIKKHEEEIAPGASGG